ncbi:hypothetical protein BU16DRAFT_593984 [Lophium mytilinum]|uniref:Uncharacterized protein n=1 Tax=Lophium mytilinum TaxID=390894 RepID=A0A6A6QJ08_9PEZI|nr:hypothetical protein BU16DRAFT_593984 [Lophium mytilinum]
MSNRNTSSPSGASSNDAASSGPYNARLRTAAAPLGAGQIDLSSVPLDPRIPRGPAPGVAQGAPPAMTQDNSFPGASNPDGISKNNQGPAQGLFQAPRVNSSSHGNATAGPSNSARSDPKPARQLAAPVVPSMMAASAIASAAHQSGLTTAPREWEDPANTQLVFMPWGQAVMVYAPPPRPLTPGQTMPRAPEEEKESNEKMEVEYLLSLAEGRDYEEETEE